jgi:O-antigen/teichoic acid export membrane protein
VYEVIDAVPADDLVELGRGRRPGTRRVGGVQSLSQRTRRFGATSTLQLWRGGDLWYVTAATVVNVANFAFFGLVGHLLRPSSYGAVAALLNVVSIAAIPLNAVQAAIVREVVIQSKDGAPPAVGRAGAVFVGSGLFATALLVGVSPLAERFFGLGTVFPVILLALWLAPSVTSSLFDGVLIGTLRWRPIAASLIAGAVVRVSFAAIAGVIGLGINGPVLATVLNASVTLGVVLWVFLRSEHAAGRVQLRLPAPATLSTVLALTGYSMLVSVDTLMARHIFPALSGNYAAAVTIGRIALFLPMAITVVVFPRFVSHEGRSRKARRLLVVALAGVLGLGLAAAFALTVGRHIFVDVLFGQRYGGASSLIALLSVEGAILGGIGLVTYFHLARRSAFAASPAIATFMVATVCLFAHPGPMGLAQLMVTTCTALLVVMVAAALTGNSARNSPARSR